MRQLEKIEPEQSCWEAYRVLSILATIVSFIYYMIYTYYYFFYFEIMFMLFILQEPFGNNKVKNKSVSLMKKRY